MPSQLTDTTGDDEPRLAAIELRYERAKARIAAVPVPVGGDGRVHDTIAVDVLNTRPPLTPARRGTDDAAGRGPSKTLHGAAPAAAAPQGGRRLWRSLRMPRLVGRGLPASW
jgi:hypothetical protein